MEDFFFNIPNDVDIIVDSGDDLPDLHKSKEVEERYQTEWVFENIENYKNFIKDKIYIHIQGNHSWIDPTDMLRQHSLNANNIDRNFYEYNNVSFYGFPYVPYIGLFNNNLPPNLMKKQIDMMERHWNVKNKVPDIMVCHGPPYKILDEGYSGRNFGCQDMKNFLIHLEKKPKYYLCGHIHEARGRKSWYGIQFINSATVYNIIEI